jgi:hypothetical protein
MEKGSIQAVVLESFVLAEPVELRWRTFDSTG